MIRISRYLAELLMMIKQNVTKYINGNIDASIDLTPKKHFLQEISLLNLSKTYCESVVKKPSEEILGNILFDLERCGEIGNLKGAT